MRLVARYKQDGRTLRVKRESHPPFAVGGIQGRLASLPHKACPYHLYLAQLHISRVCGAILGLTKSDNPGCRSLAVHRYGRAETGVMLWMLLITQAFTGGNVSQGFGGTSAITVTTASLVTSRYQKNRNERTD